jgi:hypothetical protein
MDSDLRAEIDAACREHDRMMAHDREPIGGPYVRREGPAGLLYREHEENAPAPVPTTDSVPSTAVADENTKNSAAWNEWVQAHLRNERAEVIDIIAHAMGEFGSEYVNEKLTPLSREIASLKGENAELRGMLGSVLAKLDAARASIEATEQERHVEKRELAARNQVIVERSGRIAELQRQNSESHAALARQLFDQELARRDHRIEMIETKLGMLLRWIGGDLPRGFGRTDEK